MTSSDFIRGFLGLYPHANYEPRSVALLGGIIDTSKDGYCSSPIQICFLFIFLSMSDYFFRIISFPEFQSFEGLLCLPDALYNTAFQLFDVNGSGLVSFGKYVSPFYLFRS